MADTNTGANDDATPVLTVSSGIVFAHPWAFWIGTAALLVGVILHLPDYFAASDMGYQMAGMEQSPTMTAGMVLILVGLAVAAWGLIPIDLLRHHDDEVDAQSVRIAAMDGATLSPAHWGLLFVLGIALVIDVMKPATLGFVVPGLRDEYGISTSTAALLPLSALTGTTVGSLLWGVLSDRVGRRPAILLASLMFIATAICGAMPSFTWNLVMCFLMGMSAGGMLPIVYALMAESVPAKNRGWLVVLHGGMGTVGGYLIAAGMAALLEPHFGWRILWFLGLPTGSLMVVLNRYIPESPRFLLARGRIAEAEQVMARYDVRVEPIPAPQVEAVDATDAEVGPAERVGITESPTVPTVSKGHLPGLASLFRTPYLTQTRVVIAYGVAWGFVNWGFITFLPTILEDEGVGSGGGAALLFWSSVIAIPGTIAVAHLYGNWSSKKTMVLYAGVVAVALMGFATLDPTADGRRPVLVGLIVLLLASSGGLISMLSPYTAEVYPTHLRGTGSGMAAGASKVAGMFGPATIAWILSWSPGFTAVSLVVALPVIVAASIVMFWGVETRGRSLEAIELGATLD